MDPNEKVEILTKLLEALDEFLNPPEEEEGEEEPEEEEDS
jgi:hypothetical protein